MRTRELVGDILESVARQKKIKSSGYRENGQFPIVDQSQAFIAGFTDDPAWLYRGKLPVIVFGDHTRTLKYIDFPFCVGADGTQLLRPVSGIDIRYFYYALRNVDLTNYGYERHFKYLKEEQINIPSLPIQRCISGILSAYDDLIENNLRRIKILEEIARDLYREWFIEFRFPGHNESFCVAPSRGSIPHGWKLKPLFDLAEVKYGKTLPTRNLTIDGPYVVYGAAKIIGRHAEYTREHRTIICGCRGSVGKMQITKPQCFVTNNSFTFDSLHPDGFYWLYHALDHRGLEDVIGGAAQPQITLDGISSVELVTPPLPLLSHFQNTVSIFYEQVWVLGDQVDNLRCTRDILLPKLISGEIEVSELNSTAAEGAA